MKKLAVFTTLIAAVSSFAFCGCSVTGDIGTLQEYFENDVSLTDYYRKSEEEYEQRGCEHGAQLYDIENDYIEYCTYSSIGLTLKSNKAEKEITTVTLQIRAQNGGKMNFTLFIDDDMQYESGTRSMAAGQVYSFVITGIEYPASSNRFYFKNVAPSDEPAETVYAGYGVAWKLEYLQIVYNER